MMRRLLSAVCFLGIVILFLLSSSTNYQSVALGEPWNTRTWLELGLASGIAGILLAEFLSVNGFRIADSRWIRFIVGLPMGWVFFFVLLSGEKVMSDIQLNRATKKQDLFALVDGHCGTYAGLGLRRWYALQWKGTLRDRVETYLARNACRMKHFTQMRKSKSIHCAPDDTEAQCLAFWMQTFAKRGQWISSNRRYFFDEFKKVAIPAQEADPEKKWITYALLDHDLEMGRPNLIQQAAGLEEFTDTYQYYKSADELDHLRVGKQIFEHVSAIVKAEDKNPESVRFRDIFREAQLKFEKIPELEHQVQVLRARLSYSPSL
jgi:hypothetical protein